LDEAIRHLDFQTEETEGMALSMRVNCEAGVDPAFQHIVDDEVHRPKLRKDIADYLCGAAMPE